MAAVARFRRLLALALLLCCVPAAHAATEFHVYSDHPFVNGDCGATFANLGTTLSGFDRRIRVRVGDTLPPLIEVVEVQSCGQGGFGTAQLVDAGIPVGLENGTGGGDVVEFQVPLGSINGPISARVRLAFAAVDEDSGSEDLLATVDGSPGAASIMLGVPTAVVPIPLLSPWVLFALAALMALAAILVLRRYPGMGVALLLVAGAGVAWAVHMVADGQIGDWAGIAPLATDPQGDSVPYRSNTDMLAAFGTVDGDRVFFRIDVVSLTNTPPVADPQAVSLLEDSSIVITLSGSDADGDPISFALAAPPTRGTLQNLQQDTPAPGQAQVTYVADADEFGADSFTFVVNDGQVDSAPATVSVDITPVNDPPSFTAVDPPSVLEDAGPQSVAGWATFSPGPPNESGQAVLGYFVSNVSNPGLFATPPTVANNGTLSYTPADDANGTSTFDVFVQDNGGTANGGIDVSPTQTFTITVTAVNDPPTFDAGPDQTVLEDSGPHLVAGWASAMSAGPPDEAGQALSFVVSDNTNPGLFSAGPTVDAVSGDLSFALAADAFGVAEVTLVLQDDGGTANGGSDTSTPHLLTITVTGVNDPPSFTAADPPVVEEDAGPQTLPGWASFSAGPPNESDQTVLGYVVSNVSNPALFAAPPLVANDGTLTYTAADNAHGSATFDVLVQDDGGTDNGGIDVSPAQTFTITVTPVNDPPTVLAPATATLDEDTDFVFTGADAIVVDDVDAAEGTGTLRVELAVNQGTLTLATTAGLAVAGDGTDSVTAEGPVANLNAALDGLQYAPLADYNGLDTLAILVDDLGNFPPPAEQTIASIAITIDAINDAPVLTVPGPQFVGDSETLEFSAANGNAISVDDVDAGSGSLVLDLFLSQGSGSMLLNPAAVGDLDSVSGDGSDTVQAVGTLSALNAALDGMVFTPVLGATETVSLEVEVDDQGNTGAGGAQTDAASIEIGVDTPPSVIATVPAAGAGDQATDISLSVTFSEAVDVTADWFEIACTASGVRLPADTVVNTVDAITFSIDPNSDFLAGETCTLTVFASEVTDQDTIDPPDNMLLDFILAFSMDEAPEVASTTPADGAIDQATDIAIEIVFSEAVDVAGNWFQISCSDSGIRNPADTLVNSGDGITWTVTPDTEFTQAEACTMTIFAAQVTDQDAIDPPDNMESDYSFGFGFDAAPEVTAMSPVTADGDQPTDVSVTIDFSEAVDVAVGAFQVDCGAGPEALAVTPPLPAGNITSASIAPATLWPAGATCEVTVFAAEVRDSDSNDPPDTMLVDFVDQFVTDAAPAVTGTVPADGTSAGAGSVIQIDFSEPVNAGPSAFTIDCNGLRSFTVAGSGTASIVLTPDALLPVPETCAVTVIAAEIDDVDAVDPPSGLDADYVFSFDVVAIAVADDYAVTPHLTLSSPVSVLANDDPPTVNVIGYGTGGDCNQVGPGSPLATTLSGSVTMQADGSFVYLPPAGQRNSADGFCYTITGGSSAPVTLNIANTAFVWFYQQGASGTGTQASPFGQLLGNVGGTQTGDTLYLADGSYSCGITLQNGQRVIGGASSVNLQTASGVTPVAGSAFPALSGNSPALSAGNVNCFALGQNNVLRGITIGNTGSGSGLAGNAFGTLAVSETVIQGTGRIASLVDGTLSGALLSAASTSSSAEGLQLQQVGGSFGFGNTSVAGAATQGIVVTQSTANLDFGNTTVAAGSDGVSLQNNSAGTRSFGTLGITGGSGIGFQHFAGGGAVSVSGATIITNPASAGMSIQNANAGISFAGVTVNKNSTAATGVALGNNGANTIGFGGLSVTTSNGVGVNAAASAGTTVNFGALTITSAGSGLVTRTGTYSAPSGSIAASGGAAIDADGTAFGITLATVSSTGSSAQGITLTGTSGTLTMNGGSISGPTGTAFHGSGALGTVNYAGSVAKTSAGRLIDLDGAGAATLTLSGNLSCTGTCGSGATHAGIRINARNAGTYTMSGSAKTISSSAANAGVSLTGNGGATMAFSNGGLAVTTTTGNAFHATGGGTVSVQGAGNTLTSGVGIALNVLNTNIGAGGLNFQRISATGGSSGIFLNNTGGAGSLVVTGDGGVCTSAATCTGGAIQNMSSHGIWLQATTGPSLTHVFVNNTGHHGIGGTEVNGFSLTNSVVSNSGTSLVPNRANVGFNVTAAGTERNLHGTVTITGNTLTNSQYQGIEIFNFNGTIDFAEISNNTLTSSTSAASSQGPGISLIAYGSAGTVAHVTRANINNNVVNNFPGGVGIQAQGGNANAVGSPGTFGVPGHATNIINITGNRVVGASPANRIGGEAIVALVGGHGQGNFNVANNGTVANPLANMTGIGISNSTFGLAITTSSIDNNVVVANNSFAAQGVGGGLAPTFGVADLPDMTMTVSNNSLSQIDGNGILLVARDTNGTLRARVMNNSVAAPLSGVRQGIRIDSGNAGPGENDTVCLNIAGNTSAPSVGFPAALGIGLRKQGADPDVFRFGVHGMAATGTPGVEAYVNGLNPSGGGTLLISAENGFTSCNLP